EPGRCRAIDYLDEEIGILADGIIVLQVYNDVFGGAVIGNLPQSLGGALDIRLSRFCRGNVRANAGGVDCGRRVNPGSAKGNGPRALVLLWSIGAVLAIHGNIGDADASGRERCAQLGKIIRLQRGKMGAPRFDVSHAELRGDVRAKILDRHFRPSGALLSRPAMNSRKGYEATEILSRGEAGNDRCGAVTEPVRAATSGSVEAASPPAAAIPCFRKSRRSSRKAVVICPPDRAANIVRNGHGRKCFRPRGCFPLTSGCGSRRIYQHTFSTRRNPLLCTFICSPSG